MSDTSTDRHCRRCACELSPETAVPLWDGNLYCERCVESQTPGLTDYARSHPQLEESPPKEALRSWRGLLVLWAFMFMFFGGLAVISVDQKKDPSEIIMVIVFIGFLTGFVAVIQGIGINWVQRKGLPTVIMQEGRVVVLRPGYKRMSNIRLSLGDIQWRIGKAREDTMLRTTLISNRQVVILQYTAGARWFKVTYKAACGWTDETRERWIAFLTLAGVPQG